MKKTKNWLYFADKILWWIISLLPIILYLCQILGHSGYYTDFYSFLESQFYDFNFGIFKTMVDAFFSPLGFDTTEVFNCIFYWFVFAQFMHLVVDLVLWIINFIHNILCKGLDF